jgi:hypothetical protein
VLEPPKFVVEAATSGSVKNVVTKALDHFTFCLSGESAGVLKVMFGQQDRNGCSEMKVWLALKTGNDVNDTRRGWEAVTVHDGSLLLMVQPIVVQELIDNREAFRRGLLTRMQILDPKRERQEVIRHNGYAFRNLLRHHLKKQQKFEKSVTITNLYRQTVTDQSRNVGSPTGYKRQPNFAVRHSEDCNRILSQNNSP